MHPHARPTLAPWPWLLGASRCGWLPQGTRGWLPALTRMAARGPCLLPARLACSAPAPRPGRPRRPCSWLQRGRGYSCAAPWRAVALPAVCLLAALGGQRYGPGRRWCAMSPHVISCYQVRDIMDASADMLGKEVLVKGWCRTVRDQKAFSFIEVNDGSLPKGIQVTVSAPPCAPAPACQRAMRLARLAPWPCARPPVCARRRVLDALCGQDGLVSRTRGGATGGRLWQRADKQAGCGRELARVLPRGCQAVDG